jgi:hypothetical protein
MVMKRTGIMMLVAIFILTLFPSLSTAAKLPLRVEVNGEKILFPDAQPFVDKSNRVQVPVRFVSEALGADVGWAGKTQTVTVVLDDDVITLVVGQKVFDVNGQKKQMDTAAQRKEARTFVPLRFVSEALGARVKWDAAIQTVEITTGYIENVPSQPKTDGGVKDGEKVKSPAELKKEDENTTYFEKDGKKRELYGFSFYNWYNSALSVTLGGYEKYGKEYVIFQMLTIFNHVDSDYDQQLVDAEEILRQKIDGKTVDAVMKYVKTKKKREDNFPDKEFEDKTYRIKIMTQENNGVNIKIFYK